MIRSAFRAHTSDFGMPRLGCGLAGGEWPVIAALIADELLAQGIPVTVYDLARGGTAHACR